MALDRNMIDYIQPVLQEIREYKALMNTEQVEFENGWTASEDVLKNMFIADMGESGILRWENILRITPKTTDNLADRRFRITTRLTEDLPYTMTKLIQQLEILCGADGYTLTLGHLNYLITIRVEIAASKQFEDVKTLVERMLPANLVLDIDVLYNQHITIALYTQARNGLYTHYELRTTVLTSFAYNRIEGRLLSDLEGVM